MKPHWSRIVIGGALAGALCLVGAGAGRAQDQATNPYPTRPVRIVVPYAAGGGIDALARFLARGLEARLGQPFIIENRPGQGTATAAGHVARAPADGYTLIRKWAPVIKAAGATED